MRLPTRLPEQGIQDGSLTQTTGKSQSSKVPPPCLSRSFPAVAVLHPVPDNSHGLQFLGGVSSSQSYYSGGFGGGGACRFLSP